MAQQVNQLTITAQPVLNAPEVYNAYLAYLKVEDHLRESCAPPPCGEAIAVRGYLDDDCGTCRSHSWWHKNERKLVYYWIPVEYRDDFRRLSLYTVAVRGQSTAVSPNFDVTVRGEIIDLRNQIDENDKNNYELYFRIDKRVPNDRGYMLAVIDGREYSSEDGLKILPNRTGALAQADPALDPLPENQETDVLKLSVNLATLKIEKLDSLVKGLAGQKVSLRLNHFAPRGTATDRALGDIRTQIELFRLGQFQTPK